MVKIKIGNSTVKMNNESMTPYSRCAEGYDRISRFYDLDVDTYEEDYAFYGGLAARAGGPILELGCGTGRILSRLASAGFEIDGLDMSEQILGIARRRLRESSIARPVRLINADAGDFTMDRRYNLVAFPLNSFMHLATPVRQMSCLRSVRRTLAPGGTFALDLPNPETSILGHTEQGLIVEYTKPGLLPGWTVTKLRSQTVDPVRQMLQVTLIYDEVAPSGSLRRTSAVFEMRYVHLAELEMMLSQAGLTPEWIAGDFDGGELNADSAKLVVVARRS